ncbi:hypothetical protein H0H81_012709 [Sphagnurus paluster]|uniref:Uncharacterized protein n=1 Tax=Sphagnurus paluster TaxID=117069 RepID=A0A9P7GMR0_9AGAR|nr:hypothetical protein H0H81_012709 [Sphagnurus paluster]
MYPPSWWGMRTNLLIVNQQHESVLVAVLKGKARLFANSLAIPAYVAVLSATVLIVHLVWTSNVFKRTKSRILSTPIDSEDSEENLMQTSGIGDHIKQHGGNIIFAYKIARLVGCLTLLGLTIYSSVISEKASGSGLLGVRKKHKYTKPKRGFSNHEWLELAMCMTYMYASLLALVSASVKPRWSRVVSKHINVLLLVSFGVYFYRDVFPLATYTWSPIDISEGWALWAKVIVLGLTSIAIPLFVPRRYIPIDPQNPMAVPNPEQTASLFSLVTYSFLDPTIFLAYRIPHLSHEQLPPLADYDAAQELKAKSFPHIDPYNGSKKQHLFWGLMRVFRREYMILAIMIFIQVTANFASPIGIKNLL